MSNLKLAVEVVTGHNLMSKVGQGSSSAFVELHFDNQRFRTTTKEKDPNPFWNESFYFNISDSNNLTNLVLEAYVYNHVKTNNSKSLLGKVRLTSTSFVTYSEALAFHYPLEKPGMFSRVKGELGLKVFITDDPSLKSSNPLPAMESFRHTGSRAINAQTLTEQVEDFVSNPIASDRNTESRHTLHHPPNSNLQKQQQHSSPAATERSVRSDTDETKSQQQAPKTLGMYSGSSSQSLDNDPSLKSSNPLPAMESFLHTGSRAINAQTLTEQVEDFVSNPIASDINTESRHTFHHLPNPNLQEQQQHSSPAATERSVRSDNDETKSQQQAPKTVGMYSGSSSQSLDHDPSLKSSNPLPAMESFLHTGSRAINAQTLTEQVQNFVSNPIASDRGTESRPTIHHLPDPNLQEQQQHSSPATTEQSVRSDTDEMKSQQQAPKIVGMYWGSSSIQPLDYALKETSPFLGGGQIVGGRVIRGDRPSSSYDLVERMQFLFVRVVKARELPSADITGSLDPYVEVRLGNYRGVTRHFEKRQNPEWNEVFAFGKERMQSSVLEVFVMDKDLVKDDFIGLVRIDLNEVPTATRVPPDSPLAAEWYRLVDRKGERAKGELMLAVWIGTQADEAFPVAWRSDACASVCTSATYTHLRSKVYHSPRLWYVRVNIIEVQDLVVSDNNHIPNVHVKAQIGNQILKTKTVQVETMNSLWNEELMFVAAEPFDEHLIFSVEDRVGPGKDEVLGKVIVPLSSVEKRADDRIVRPQWYNFDKSSYVDGDQHKFSSRLHVRVSLDGGYHVLDESTHSCSDLRPTAKQLWKPSIGVLELGILNADRLLPMKTRDGKGTSDTYCVAKYSQKWIRTRTIINSLSPKYNEQYTWEVYDPATVITVGVFDNGQIGEKGSTSNRDTKIGKIRIRLSTLETGRVYTHSYPLLVLHSSGVKKTGELHLAIRFSCTSMVNMMMMYPRPLLPKMHYVRPLTIMQLDTLRYQAVNIVAARLSRAEPPLSKEVVEYMSDVDSHLWSMRRSKANFFRVMTVFSGLLSVGKWFGEVCMWKNPITTVLVHVLFIMLVCFPELILPTVFLYMFLIGLWRFPYRPRYPPYMNTRISHADATSPDELDEEFDTFPTTRSPELVRMRYDRLRSVTGRIQTAVGDVAIQVERFQSLLSWRDPRATTLFLTFCVVAAIVLYTAPFQVLALLTVFYLMRHPRFRHRLPSAPINFFRRLADRTDSML